jgi:hypothetical protein
MDKRANYSGDDMFRKVEVRGVKILVDKDGNMTFDWDIVIEDGIESCAGVAEMGPWPY